MVANRQQPQQGTVAGLITGLLDRGYEKVAQPVLNAIARSTSSGIVEQRLKELEAEAQRLEEAGERLRPDNPVLRALLADLEDELKADARLINGAAQPLQTSGTSAAGVVQRQLALPGMTNQQLARIGVQWNTPSPDAVASLVQYAQSDEWADLMNSYASDVLKVVNNQAIRGIALGWSPLRTAREIRRMTTNLPAYVANNQMRTLQLTSYRDGTAIHQNANIAIIEQVIRVETLDERTCLSCIALHGDVMWDAEVNAGEPVPRVNDHHAGRGTSVVKVRGRDLNIRSGTDWFNSLDETRQQQQRSFADSPAKYHAWKAGTVQLSDFIQPYSDPVFGNMIRESSLTGILGDDAQRFMK